MPHGKASCEFRVSPPQNTFQLRVSLRYIKPPIWRRVQTNDCSLDELHDIIQVSMGWEDERSERLRRFQPFQVNENLFALAKPKAIFMHCLPAKRDEEVTDGVIESPRSVVFDQAENRLHTQKALLMALLG